jgi:hypothetical protein
MDLRQFTSHDGAIEIPALIAYLVTTIELSRTRSQPARSPLAARSQATRSSAAALGQMNRNLIRIT